MSGDRIRDGNGYRMVDGGWVYVMASLVLHGTGDSIYPGHVSGKDIDQEFVLRLFSLLSITSLCLSSLAFLCFSRV